MIWLRMSVILIVRLGVAMLMTKSLDPEIPVRSTRYPRVLILPILFWGFLIITIII